MIDTTPAAPRVPGAPVALVTGAAGGLGHVITRVLLDDGFRVALVDRDARKVDEVARGLDPSLERVLPLVADITDEPGVAGVVQQVAERWGGVDALVNNAGIEPDHHIVDIDMKAWDATFDVNVRAPMLLVKYCAPHWIEQGHGTVAFIGSRTWLSGSSHVAYAASKAAVVGLSRSIASELGPSGVTSNVVAPSFVRTPLHVERDVEAFAAAFTAATPLRRLIEPIDVANTVAFLVSERARNISGEVIHVAGGVQLAPKVSSSAWSPR